MLFIATLKCGDFNTVIDVDIIHNVLHNFNLVCLPFFCFVTTMLQVIRLLTDMLEKGCTTYHHPVLKLLHEYMKLQDFSNIEIKKISDLVITATTRHIKVYSYKMSVLMDCVVFD